MLPVLRLILAQEERERNYGIQEKSLPNLFIKTLNISTQSADGIKIMQCNEYELQTKIGEVMKSRASEGGKLSLHDADVALNNMSENQQSAFQQNELK